MKTLNLISLSLAALLAAASSANAATISDSFTYGPEGIPLSAHTIGSLDLFDPSLGTLTKVELTLNSSTNGGTITWDNESAVITDVLSLQIGATVVVSDPFSALVVTGVPVQSGSQLGVSADNDAAPDFVGSDSFTVTGNSGTDSDSVISTAPGVLALYSTGPGTFNVSGSSALFQSVSTSGGFGPPDYVAGLTSGEVIVTYTYTPVPEPSTFVLGGLGLMGLVALVRRKAR